MYTHFVSKYGYVQTKTLKDLLVPSALPDLNRTDNLNSDVVGCFRCDRKVCDACHKFLLPSNRIKSVATGKSYKIRHSLSCCTDYIIYCAICLLCNRQCVGSSVNFRARLSNHKSHIKQKKRTCRPGGELPYEEYMGVCHELGSYFQEKIPKRVCQFFHKNSEKGYNICKKFQIGSVILMTQMTNQKKTELIDFFDLVWTKNPQFWKIF